MTLDEHIKMLQGLRDQIGHGKFQVHFSYNYGDYWKTKVAPEVEDAEIAHVVYSDYHNMPKLLDDDKAQELQEAHEAEHGCEPSDDAEEGRTGIMDGRHEVMQVILIS